MMQSIEKAVSTDINASLDVAYPAVHFIGAKRSGNHAILSWLGAEVEAATESEVMHFNNVEDKYNVGYSDRPPRIPRDEIEADSRGLIPLLSYEDLSVGEVRALPQHQVSTKGGIVDIVIARDFPNMVASRLKRIRNLEEQGLNRAIQRVPWFRVAELWVDNASTVLANNGVCSSAEQPVFGISYNDWCESIKYRDAVAARLGLTNHDLAVGNVSPMGKGSSFDGVEFNGEASKMEVSKRWQAMIYDPHYISIIQDMISFLPEIEELNQDLFKFSANPVNQLLNS